MLTLDPSLVDRVASEMGATYHVELIRNLGIRDLLNPRAAGLPTGENEGEVVKARVMLAKAHEELHALALNISTIIGEGDPQTALIEEVRKRAADCIFVGALGFDTGLKRSGLGSVAMGLVRGMKRRFISFAQHRNRRLTMTRP